MLKYMYYKIKRASFPITSINKALKTRIRPGDPMNQEFIVHSKESLIKQCMINSFGF